MKPTPWHLSISHVFSTYQAGLLSNQVQKWLFILLCNLYLDLAACVVSHGNRRRLFQTSHVVDNAHRDLVKCSNWNYNWICYSEWNSSLWWSSLSSSNPLWVVLEAGKYILLYALMLPFYMHLCISALIPFVDYLKMVNISHFVLLWWLCISN